MKRSITIGMAACLALILFGGMGVNAEEATESSPTPTFVDEDGDGINDLAALRHRFGRRHGRGFGRGMGAAELVWIGTELTDEQKAAIQEKVDAMRAEDVPREEIHAAVGEMLAGYNIDLPADGSWRLGRRGDGSQVWVATALTEEQQTALREKIDGMRQEGASRDAIHAATAEVLAGFGISIPEDASWRMGHDRSGGFGRLGSLLTEEQHADLQAKIDKLREEGAGRDEIHAAIQDELEAMGIEAPAKGGRGGRHGRGGMRGRMGRK